MNTPIIFTIFLLIPLVICLYYKKVIYFYYYSIIVYWFPFRLPKFGFVIPEFFIYSGIIYYFIIKGKKNNLNIPIYVKLFFIFFFLGSITSYINSINNDSLAIGLRQTVIFPISFIFLSHIVITRLEQINISLRLFMISTVFLILLLYFYPNSGYWISYRGENSVRLGGEYLFFNKYKAEYYESTLGALLGFLLPTFFSIYISKINFKKIYFLLLIIIFIGLFLTQGRAGLISGIIGVSIILLSNILAKKNKKFRNIFIVFIVAIISYLTLTILFPRSFINNLIHRYLSIQNFKSVGTFQIRLYQWYWALDVFANNIFGIGFWNFTEITGMQGRNIAGNSTWLMLLLDVGIIGIAGFLILYINLLRIMIRKINFYIKKKIYLFSGLLASLLVLPISGSGENFMQSAFYANFSVWFIISMAISMLSISNKNFINIYDRKNINE